MGYIMDFGAIYVGRLYVSLAALTCSACSAQLLESHGSCHFSGNKRTTGKKAPFEKRTLILSDFICYMNMDFIWFYLIWKANNQENLSNFIWFYLLHDIHPASRACPEVGQQTVWEEDMNMDGHGSFFVRHARISDKQTRWRPHLDTLAGW